MVFPRVRRPGQFADSESDLKRGRGAAILDAITPAMPAMMPQPGRRAGRFPSRQMISSSADQWPGMHWQSSLNGAESWITAGHQQHWLGLAAWDSDVGSSDSDHPLHWQGLWKFKRSSRLGRDGDVIVQEIENFAESMVAKEQMWERTYISREIEISHPPEPLTAWAVLETQLEAWSEEK
jgi:hypothetical protein